MDATLTHGLFGGCKTSSITGLVNLSQGQLDNLLNSNDNHVYFCLNGSYDNAAFDLLNKYATEKKGVYKLFTYAGYQHQSEANRKLPIDQRVNPTLWAVVSKQATVCFAADNDTAWPLAELPKPEAKPEALAKKVVKKAAKKVPARKPAAKKKAAKRASKKAA